MDILNEFQTWCIENRRYAKGEENGIRIETLDNPGWWVSIDLKSTAAEYTDFAIVNRERSKNDWFDCKIRDNRFEGTGGPRNLTEIIKTFLKWRKESVVGQDLMFQYLNSGRLSRWDLFSPRSVETDTLSRLQDWYAENCGDDWEEEYGVTMHTTSNAGWLISIDLIQTIMEDVEFADISVHRSGNNWYSSQVLGAKFEGSCGPGNLSEILELFLEWCSKRSADQEPVLRGLSSMSILHALQEWRARHPCDQEDGESVLVETTGNPGWSVSIDLVETLIKDIPFAERNVRRAKNNWLNCSVQGRKFQGTGGPRNLPEILGIFLKWCKEHTIVPSFIAARQYGPISRMEFIPSEAEGISVLDGLQDWFIFNYGDRWEEEHFMTIKALNKTDWSVSIDVMNTILENVPFTAIHEERSGSDWMDCRVREIWFEGTGGSRNLIEILEVFLSWWKEIMIE